MVQVSTLNFILLSTFIALQLSKSQKGGSKPFNREVTGIGQNTSLRQMGVKVVKATGLGGRGAGGEDVTGQEQRPYVVIEVDEPGQRYQTQPVLGMAPVWDQQFSV